MENKNFEEKQLNEVISEINNLIDLLVNLCEEYQNKYNSMTLSESENTMYEDRIFTYYTFIAFQLKSFKSIKDKKEVEEIVARFNEKAKYIKSLTLVRNDESISLETIIKNKINDNLSGKNKNPNIVKIRIPNKSFSSVFVNTIVGFVLNFIILFAMSGFFEWGKWTSIKDFALFLAYYSVVEALIKIFVVTALNKLIFKTFGLILLLPFVLSLMCVCFFPVFIEITSIFTLIMASLISNLIRKFIIDYFIDKKIRKEMRNLTEGE